MAIVYQVMTIKKILTEMKYNHSKDNLLNQNKNTYEKRNVTKNSINHILNNRSNSYIISEKGNFNKSLNLKNQKLNLNYNYPTINRKKTDIFYQKLPQFKMNFDIGDSNLIQDDKNNTPSFKRHDQNRVYFNDYFNENEYLSFKF